MKSAKADFTGEWVAGEVRGCGLISLIRCMSRLGRMSAMHMNLWSGWHTALNRRASREAPAGSMAATLPCCRV